LVALFSFPAGVVGQDCRDFAVLQLSLPEGGAKLDITGPSNVFGNIGIGPAGRGSRTGDSIVSDAVCLHDNPEATFQQSGPGGVGSIVTTSLAQPIDDALLIAQKLAAFPPTLVLVRIGQGDLITGNGGLNVIAVGDVDLSSGVASLNGSSEDIFVLNISGKFKLSGGAAIELSGGVEPGHVFYNLLGVGEDVAFSGGSTAPGIFLAPERKVALSPGFVEGSVTAGHDISITSGGEVTFVENPCELKVDLVSDTVSPGDELEFSVYLLHTRTRDVNAAFWLSIEDANGKLLKSRHTQPFAISFLDQLRLAGGIGIPQGTPPGEYRLILSIGNMKQGLARVKRTFIVS
jgi:hypothetical protein